MELLKTTKMVVGAPYSKPKQLKVVMSISKMVKVTSLGARMSQVRSCCHAGHAHMIKHESHQSVLAFF